MNRWKVGPVFFLTPHPQSLSPLRGEGGSCRAIFFVERFVTSMRVQYFNRIIEMKMRRVACA
jgi:hypothetical protein